MNCKCALVPAFSESKWFRYSEVIRLGGHIWVTDAHLAAKQLWHQSNRESAWMLRYLEVFREQVNCCLPAFMVHAQCCCLLYVGALLMERVLDEGRVERLHAQSKWVLTELAETSAVQGLVHTQQEPHGSPAYVWQGWGGWSLYCLREQSTLERWHLCWRLCAGCVD